MRRGSARTSSMSWERVAAGAPRSASCWATARTCSTRGELDNWLVRSGVPQVEDPERITFWERVRAADDPDGASALFGNEAQRAIERSLSLLRVHKWRTRHQLVTAHRAVAEDCIAGWRRGGSHSYR